MLQTITVIAEVEKTDTDAEIPVAEDTESGVNVACGVVPSEESASAAEEHLDMSELEQVLPKLPPRQPQVPPRPAGSRSRLSLSLIHI